jgi:GMP synthase-like glutamine amidotransferase
LNYWEIKDRLLEGFSLPDGYYLILSLNKQIDMNAHFFQHVPFEGIGNIEPWLIAKGYEITSTQFYKNSQLPDYQKIDLLIIMGGPMSVNDEAKYPWLVAEKQFIRNCIEAGKSVLGICLGSQLIANAMGASVYRNHEKEIGWFPVKGIEHPDPLTFRFPYTFEVFHWHGDTFDLPKGAVRLARSETTENQAFQLGKSVVGIQFHPEATPALLQEMVSHGRSELVVSNYVQSEKDILGIRPQQYHVISSLMGEVLTFLVSASPPGPSPIGEGEQGAGGEGGEARISKRFYPPTARQ